MKKQGTIVFRCDGSPLIGSGHVMRCLSLAEYLKAKAFEIIFWVSQETIEHIPHLTESGFKTTTHSPSEPYDWLIVDHYGLDREFEAEARGLANKIMVIDDLADRKHDCDILLDQTWGRRKTDYASLIPPHAIQLLGTSFAILREEFRNIREDLNRKFETPQSILICFGGVNPKQASEKAIAMLSDYTERTLDITITLGGNEDVLSPVEKAVSQAEKTSKHNYTLRQNANDMTALMTNADLAIGAGGTMSWERCAMALPCLTLELADNQANVLKQLDEVGAIENLGKIEELSDDDFLNAFKALINDSKTLKNMSDTAASICDARGVERILCHLLKPSLDKLENNVTIRMADKEDCEQVYQWQTEDGARQYARNPEPPQYEEHVQWFHNKIRCPSSYLFIVSTNGKPCGIARLDPKSDDKIESAYEVSILISQQSQGKGVAKAALDQLSKYAPNANLIAEVNAKNNASIQLFKNSGYVQCDKTWYVLEA